MVIERIAVALGFDLPKERKPVTRLIVFAVLGGVLLSAAAFVLLFVATAVIWPAHRDRCSHSRLHLLVLQLEPFSERFQLGANENAKN
jgi:hypothetical protein